MLLRHARSGQCPPSRSSSRGQKLKRLLGQTPRIWKHSAKSTMQHHHPSQAKAASWAVRPFALSPQSGCAPIQTKHIRQQIGSMPVHHITIPIIVLPQAKAASWAVCHLPSSLHLEVFYCASSLAASIFDAGKLKLETDRAQCSCIAIVGPGP